MTRGLLRVTPGPAQKTAQSIFGISVASARAGAGRRDNSPWKLASQFSVSGGGEVPPRQKQLSPADGLIGFLCFVMSVFLRPPPGTGHATSGLGAAAAKGHILSAPWIMTLRRSPGLRSVSGCKYTFPSISGASQCERARAPSVIDLVDEDVDLLPMRGRGALALITCFRRHQPVHSARLSFPRARPGRALAAAPSTGS